MQSPVISDPQFQDWIYTVIGLFLGTGFLILAFLLPNYVNMKEAVGFVFKPIILILVWLWDKIWYGLSYMRHRCIKMRGRGNSLSSTPSGDDLELRRWRTGLGVND
jgi:hypothetical protein